MRACGSGPANGVQYSVAQGQATVLGACSCFGWLHAGELMPPHGHELIAADSQCWAMKMRSKNMEAKPSANLTGLPVTGDQSWGERARRGEEGGGAG